MAYHSFGGEVEARTPPRYAASTPRRHQLPRIPPRRKIQSAGGKTAHALGKAHVWTPAEARKAGRKGGKKLKGSKWSRLQGELRTGEALLKLADLGEKRRIASPTDLSERHDDYLSDGEK
jgi:hypothetical protein